MNWKASVFHSFHITISSTIATRGFLLVKAVTSGTYYWPLVSHCAPLFN